MIKNIFTELFSNKYYKTIDTQQPSKQYENRIMKQIDSDLKEILKNTEELRSDIRFIKEYLSKK